MKRLMAVLVVLAMVSVGGCAAFQSVCHPTADQQAAVQSYQTQAQTLLIFLQGQTQNITVQQAIAAIQAAMAVYQQVLSGVCVAADVINAAVTSVNTTQTLATAKMGFKG
jgi:hypothetical protein